MKINANGACFCTNIRLLLALVVAAIPSIAFACPPGMYPISNPHVAACAPIPSTGPVVRSIAPEYKSRWGAIAIGKDDRSGRLGFSSDAASESAATRQAIKDCEQKGESCRAWATYSNQCMAMASIAENGVPIGGLMTIGYGASPAVASQNALSDCEGTAGAGRCVTFQQACSMPKLKRGLFW